MYSNFFRTEELSELGVLTVLNHISFFSRSHLSNDKTITPPSGRSLSSPAAHPLCGSQTMFALLKKYFRSSAMQGFFKKNWKQNKLVQLVGLIFSSLLKMTEAGVTEKYKINITRQAIADLTGLRVETVIRAIKNMESAGVVQIINRSLFI